MKLPSLKLPSLKPTPKKRPPLTRFQKIGFAVAPLPLIAILIVGVISENGPKSDAAASAASRSVEPEQSPIASEPADAEPSPASEPPSTEPSPSPEPSSTEQEDDVQEEPREYDETHLQFGQTARFTTRAGDSSTPLEFTVSAPKPFTPSKDATVFQAGSLVTTKGKLHPTNVYFTVTVRNTSKSESWDADFFFSSVSETGEDDVVSEVYDGDIEGLLGFNGGEDLQPGKSVTLKDGFSVKSAENIQYELDVDGLAGRSFYFTR